MSNQTLIILSSVLIIVAQGLVMYLALKNKNNSTHEPKINGIIYPGDKEPLNPPSRAKSQTAQPIPPCPVLGCTIHNKENQ